MKNLLVILFFSIFSLLSLVVMIFLIFLPKLCVCFNTFYSKNYQNIKKQNTRARRIKRARLRLLFKNQISHEQPTKKELDRSEGVFFDEESQCRLKDEESLLRFNKGQFETLSVKQVFLNSLIHLKQRFQILCLSVLTQIRETVLPSMQNVSKLISDNLRRSFINGKAYYEQFRSYLNASVGKYFH